MHLLLVSRVFERLLLVSRVFTCAQSLAVRTHVSYLIDLLREYWYTRTYIIYTL